MMTPFILNEVSNKIKCRYFLSQLRNLGLYLFTILIRMLMMMLVLLIVFQSYPYDMLYFISRIWKSNFSTLLTSSRVTSLVHSNIKVTRSEVLTPSYISRNAREWIENEYTLTNLTFHEVRTYLKYALMKLEWFKNVVGWK